MNSILTGHETEMVRTVDRREGCTRTYVIPIDWHFARYLRAVERGDQTRLTAAIAFEAE